MDTSGSEHGDVGIVMVVPVGMSHVASVNLITVDSTQVAKADEFGYFAFAAPTSSSCSRMASIPRWIPASVLVRSARSSPAVAGPHSTDSPEET